MSRSLVKNTLCALLVLIALACCRTGHARAASAEGDRLAEEQPTDEAPTGTVAAAHVLYIPFVAAPLSPAPAVEAVCPATSLANYSTIPVEWRDPYVKPDYLNHEFNMVMRGWLTTTAYLGLVDYEGDIDPNAPRLHGLFSPARSYGFSHAFQVNGWRTDPAECGGNPNGCPGAPMTTWDVTLVGIATMPGETIYPAPWLRDIYQSVYRMMVLYADEQQIALTYTRDDSPRVGYLLHLANVCVDPNLLALYRAQNSQGWRITNNLPALRNGEAIGTALGREILVAIRDSGAWMDPRSRKDWWQQP